MYEFTCKMIESLELINITTFDENQFLTCYLIFNFRQTYFSYFQKIIPNSICHNVKKQVEKNFHPRSQGVKKINAQLRHCYAKHIFGKKSVGTSKGKSGLIRGNWYFWR